jgi:hypothetical protein
LGQVTASAFSPDGQGVPTASYDYTALILSIITLDDILRLAEGK